MGDQARGVKWGSFPTAKSGGPSPRPAYANCYASLYLVVQPSLLLLLRVIVLFIGIICYHSRRDCRLRQSRLGVTVATRITDALVQLLVVLSLLLSGSCRLRQGVVKDALERDHVGVLGSSSLAPRPDVDDGELDERREREDETRRHPDVDRLHVGDARQLVTWPGRLGRQRQHGQKAEVDARHHRVDADPERQPRQDDEQDARDVVLDEEVAEVASDDEDHLETRRFTRRIRYTHSQRQRFNCRGINSPQPAQCPTPSINISR